MSRFATFVVCAVVLSVAATGVRAAQQPTATVTGRVFDSEHEPLGNARVTLVPLPAPPGFIGPPPQTVTGDDGRFAIDAVVTGRYMLQAQKNGYVSPLVIDSLPFAVEAGSQFVVPDVRLDRAAAITGRVFDSKGAPMPNLTVTAVRRPGATGLGGIAITSALPAGQPGQTNDGGEFNVTGLPAGDFYVAAGPRPDPASRFARPSPSSGTSPVTTYYPGLRDMTSAQIVTVAAGQTVSGLEFTVAFAPAFTVSGSVLDEGGSPVGGAYLTLMPKPSSPPFLGPQRSVRSNPDGTFAFADVVLGTYQLSTATSVSVSSTAVSRGGVSTSSTVASSVSPGQGSVVSVTVGDGDVRGVTVVVRR